MDSKEHKTEQSPVVTTVTRPKHPGRVAQGYKLAALMKERKEALVKNKDSEVGTELKAEVDKQQLSHTLQYSGLGIIFLLATGGIVYYLYTHKKSPPILAEPMKKQPKIWME